MREFLKKYFPFLRPIVRYFRKIDHRLNHKRRLRQSIKQALKLVFNLNNVRYTSESDDGLYPLICYLASKYDEVFKDFKRNFLYNRILECTSEQEEYGSHMLKLIAKIPNFSPTLDDWREFAKNDLYGNPRVYPVDFDGKKINISSTTIRYVKVLGDIISMFDTSKIKTIAEVGVGYGGQCRVILNKLPIESYTLFDLPEVLGLTEKFLSHYDEGQKNIRYVDSGHIYINDDYDFFMSNYAFTELKRELQDFYVEKIILKSRSGYITWNEFSENKFGGYSVDEFMKLIPGSSRIEIDYPGECLVIWGNK